MIARGILFLSTRTFLKAHKISQTASDVYKLASTLDPQSFRESRVRNGAWIEVEFWETVNAVLEQNSTCLQENRSKFTNQVESFAAGRVFLHPRENLRRVLERFAGDLSTTIIISARPLADLSPVPIAQGVTLSRRRRKSRVEALIIRAYSQSTYTQAVTTNEPDHGPWCKI